MKDALSANTKAILLLTAPLLAGRGKKKAPLLSRREYESLARHLRELEAEPADLLRKGSKGVLDACEPLVPRERLEALLSRGFQLTRAVESWRERALWVMSRADPTYPRRLKKALSHNSPPILYGCGDPDLLNIGGLAVVGSRHVDEAILDFSRRAGGLAAAAGRALVSGGAKGVDQAAMQGALSGGGRAVGVLANGLARAATQRTNRNAFLEGRLVLISPYDPKAGFNVGHAMQRNKLVYALSDAALVVNAEVGKGGTWIGAVEQLEKLHLVPVYVRSPTEAVAGLMALRERGAITWPDPDVEMLNDLLCESAGSTTASEPQLQLTLR